MSQPSAGSALALISKPALLVTESIDDYESLIASLNEAIGPRNFIERLYVSDIGAIVYEIGRLRRCKSAMINTAFRGALEQLLIQFGKEPGETIPYQESEALAFEWFTDPQAKQDVAEILNKFNLDESAIEAEAIKSIATDLEVIDRMLRSLEVRRDRALHGITEYRKNFAERVREVSDRILNAGPILQLQTDQRSV